MSREVLDANGKFITEFKDQPGLHYFFNELAKKYNITYKTTFGVFNDQDVYSNGYFEAFTKEL